MFDSFYYFVVKNSDTLLKRVKEEVFSFHAVVRIITTKNLCKIKNIFDIIISFISNYINSCKVILLNLLIYLI